MKLALMQPYIFPYIGYYQLAFDADTFVFYDDVNFINRGYINRNSILSAGKALRFTVPLIGASQNKLIKDIDCGTDVKKILKTISQSYAKAPYFNDVMPLVESVITSEERNLAKVASDSVKQVFDYLGIEKNYIDSSSLDYDRDLDKVEKIYDICRATGADTYVNAPGGRELYDSDEFEKQNIELWFIEKESDAYAQGNCPEFVDNLSMIDVLMWNDKASVVELLKQYRLAK